MTANEIRALDLIRESIAVGGFAPTIREIATQIGVTVSAAHGIVDALVYDGRITRVAGKHRGLDIAGAVDLRAVPTDTIRAELARRGVTLEALSTQAPRAYGRARSCAADSCGAAVERGHLMCRTHWFALPAALRQRILSSNSAHDRSGFECAVTEARDLIDSGAWRQRA